jgi:tape measure domain-containing protein
MAMNRLIIVASIQGVQGVVQQINNIGNAAQGASVQASRLGQGLGAIVAATGVAMLARYSDAFVDIQNKLALVTDGTRELTAVTNELYAVSQRSRTAFDTTAKLYQRVALTGRALGNTQETNLRVTELLNKATIVSGASTIEASNALIQLSQGMAKGVLNGDELRSVLEQLPYIGDLIAKQMGVTRGELRGLGADGKITAQIVQEAILAAGQEIETQFGKTVPTIGQAITVLSSALTKFVGEFNSATGVFTAFARGIILASENLDILTGALAAAALGFAALRREAIAGFAVNALAAVSPLTRLALVMNQTTGTAGALRLSLRTLAIGLADAAAAGARAAIGFALANPILAALAALALLVPLIERYGDNIKLTTDGTFSLRDAMHEIGSAISSGVAPAVILLNDAIAAIIGGFNTLLQLIGTLLSPFTGYADILQVAGGGTMSLGTAVYALIEGFLYMGRVIMAAAILPLRGLAEILYGIGAIDSKAMEGIRASTDRILNIGQAALEAQGRIRAFAAGTTEAGAAAAGSVGGLNSYAGASNAAGSAAKNQTAAIKEKKSWLMEEDIITTKIVNGQVQALTIFNSATAAITAQSQGLASHASAIRASADGVNAITASEAYYAEKSAEAKKATEEATKSTSALNTNALKPASASMTALAGNSALAVENYGGLNEATSALNQGTSEAAASIRSLASALASSAENALRAAEAYREAAAAAKAMRDAGGSPNGGATTIQHNGAIRSQAAVRYHSGGLAGLRPDEYSAVLQRGEEVLTKDDPRNRLNNGYQFNQMLTAYGFPTDDPSQAAYGNDSARFDPRGALGNSRWDDPAKTGMNGGFDATVWNGTSVTYAQPLEQMLEEMKKNGEELPTLMANAFRTDNRGYNGSSSGFAEYNAWDPFGRGIAEIQATGLAKSGWGDSLSDWELSDLQELMKMQDIWTKNFNGEWFTKDDLNSVMAQERAAGHQAYDNQSALPWQQSYQGQGTYGWQPDLVATNQGGAGGEPKIEVKMELHGVKDEASFRKNADQIEAQVYGMVERARRRRKR